MRGSGATESHSHSFTHTPHLDNYGNEVVAYYCAFSSSHCKLLSTDGQCFKLKLDVIHHLAEFTYLTYLAKVKVFEDQNNAIS